MVPLGFWNGKDSGTVVFLVGHGSSGDSMYIMWERWEVIDYYTLGSLICSSILIVNLQGQGLASSFQRDQLYRYIIGRNNID